MRTEDPTEAEWTLTLSGDRGMNPDPLTVWPDDEPEDSGAVIVYLAAAVLALVVAIVVIFLVAGR